MPPFSVKSISVFPAGQYTAPRTGVRKPYFIMGAVYTASGSGRGYYVTSGDFDGDGTVDIANGNYDTDSIHVFFGQGDGTFGAAVSIASNADPAVMAVDLDGDNDIDLVATKETAQTVSVHLNQGDGSFAAPVSYSHGNDVYGAVVKDFDEDGALDIAVGAISSSPLRVFIANTQESSLIAPIDLRTRQSSLASMEVIDATLERLNSERRAIGAVQSRLDTAVNNLQVSRENIASAESQISDADVSVEAAKLVRNRIIQQAGAAVLAQANQGPALALALLGGV